MTTWTLINANAFMEEFKQVDQTKRPMPKALANAAAADRPPMIRRPPMLSEVQPELCRRTSIRYPIAADVVYHLMKDRKISTYGRGRSVNISSGGILLYNESVLPEEGLIELRIAWPVKLDQHVPLTLHVSGRTMRSEGNYTAIAILRYEFRTRRKALPVGFGAASI